MGKCAIIRFAACAAVAGLAVGCCSVVKPGYDTLIAHRGESVDAPENTLPAYKTAVERGFGFECDIYLSKDGRVFTFHDRNLKRTTGGANTNKCADHPAEVGQCRSVLDARGDVAAHHGVEGGRHRLLFRHRLRN